MTLGYFDKAATLAIFAGCVTIATLTTSQTNAQSIAAACDRVCLTKYVDDYAMSLIKHDPSGLPLASDVKVSENGKPINIGEGIWKSTVKFYSAPSSTQYVQDVQTGQVALMGVIDVGVPAIYAVRLQIKDGKITEIENLVKRESDAGGPFQPEGYLWREAPFIREMPAKIRSSRAKLAATADSYWTKAVTTHKGQAYMPDCIHVENGMNTDWERPLTSWEAYDVKNNMPSNYDGRIWTCERELELSTHNWKAVIPERRLIDEERGLVLDWNLVRREGPGPTNPATMPDGSPVVMMAYGPPARGPDGWPRGALGAAPAGGPFGPGGPGAAGAPRGAPPTPPPSTNYHAQLFRIVDGKISREQVFWISLPAAAAAPF